MTQIRHMKGNHPAELEPLYKLARAMGVHTTYVDGLGRTVDPSPETLVRICAALGAHVTVPKDAKEALVEWRRRQAESLLPPVLVAWDGRLGAVPVRGSGQCAASVELEDGTSVPLRVIDGQLQLDERLPSGYHRLLLLDGDRSATSTIIAAPERSWRRQDSGNSWGVGVHLSALRGYRSRAVGDLRDLETLCEQIREHGGDLVTLLPLLPTFNSAPPEPSPYSPVSRLFWSELILDLGERHEPVSIDEWLDVGRADREVRLALAGVQAPKEALTDDEVVRYARFRGAQRRLGRNWRDWPAAARSGVLAPGDWDEDEERFHLVAQYLARRQLQGLRSRLEARGVRLGLDLAVGVHPDGYDPWSRQSLFASGMSVGAPPDLGFPSGQDWGFSPLLPGASRAEGHAYLAASIAHQASLAGLLRIDHIMAWSRLYWIPHGMPLDQGSYVNYPAEEQFAVLCLESHRNHCEIIGENLGTVPDEIREALPRHGIRGMYLAQFDAAANDLMSAPDRADVALIGTHDTPTFAGWVKAHDVEPRVRHKLLDPSTESLVRQKRAEAVALLRSQVAGDVTDEREVLTRLLDWLGRSNSTLVIPWLEDFWLEPEGVNLPGTRSSDHPNWQRPMRRLLDDITADADVAALFRCLQVARSHSSKPTGESVP